MSLFPLGQVVATPGALATLARHQTTTSELLARHSHGDWGELCSQDQQANQEAVADGTRILSSYQLDGVSTVWVITEADRSATCFLLPDEY